MEKKGKGRGEGESGGKDENESICDLERVHMRREGEGSKCT